MDVIGSNFLVTCNLLQGTKGRRQRYFFYAEEIEKQKVKVLNELKTQVAVLSVDMAEKILRGKMQDRAQQESFVNENLKSISLN